MRILLSSSTAVRALLAARGATNPRIFGSVARGDAGPDSDIDLIVDLPGQQGGAQFVNASGLTVELRELLGVPVDVVTATGLRSRIDLRVLAAEAIPL